MSDLCIALLSAYGTISVVVFGFIGRLIVGLNIELKEDSIFKTCIIPFQYTLVKSDLIKPIKIIAIIVATAFSLPIDVMFALFIAFGKLCKKLWEVCTKSYWQDRKENKRK